RSCSSSTSMRCCSATVTRCPDAGRKSFRPSSNHTEARLPRNEKGGILTTMTKALVLLSALVVAVAVAAGCGSSNNDKSSSTSTTTPATSTTNTTSTTAGGGGSNLKLSADPSGALKFDKTSLSA